MKILSKAAWTVSGLIVALTGVAQGESQVDPTTNRDRNEVQLQSQWVEPSDDAQAMLRRQSAWANWGNEHPRWRAVMDERTGMPHRAFGPGIVFEGATVEDRSEAFAEAVLSDFGVSETVDWISTPGRKHEFAFAQQYVEGIRVEGGRLVTKWVGDQLVMWGADWFRDAALPGGEPLDTDVLKSAAKEGVMMDIHEATIAGGLLLLPTRMLGKNVYKLLAEFEVRGRVGAIPRKYKTWVDVYSGEVLMRKNLVNHMGENTSGENTSGENTSGELVVISGQIQAPVLDLYPFESEMTGELAFLPLNFSGDALTTDAEGSFISNATGPQSVQVELAGLWSHVYTNGSTPSSNVSFQDGYNALNLSALGNIKERSAYRSVNRIHEHMKVWLPDFTGLDWSMTTNIDVQGECNAFFDGSSINFFAEGGGCNATSLIADVVWHEYGHGINSMYYESLGYWFQNGAMGEGYADFWAMSLGDLAEIGKGFYTDSEDGIRIYSEDPKVYPEDLVGEVHADGEIICGAWYDTHLLMGGDWTATMELFIDAYAGLQATWGDGEEGAAFTDVLLDALQADDDDADLSNGTPNSAAIIEGFAIHGITLFSYAEIEHEPLEFIEADLALVLEVETQIVFPFNLYLDGVYCWYKTSVDGEWEQVEMVEEGSAYTAEIPAQPAGTVVAYYMGIQDDFGGLSAVTPVAAAAEDNPNVPFFTLVGVDPVLINDSDDYSDFGFWTIGLSTDNATTGQWEETYPVGSYGEPNDPSTIAAPTQDHTQGLGGYAFLTGQNPGVNDGIGVNDVDAGHTTLITPVIDLSEYEDPVMSYWRWYCNAPYTGANPGADWWQVEVSNDGGETWAYFENTLRQDLAWRRVAFRVADVIEPTDAFRMRFIASDSTTIGEYLDGGSLIEAALDDIILYDLADPDGVAESEAQAHVTVFPNPVTDRCTVTGLLNGAIIRVYSSDGRLVLAEEVMENGQAQVSVSGWAPGTYVLTCRDRHARRVTRTLEVVE